MELSQFNGQFSEQDAEQMVDKLDTLLSNYQAFHKNVRVLHWNRKMRPFEQFSGSIAHLDELLNHQTSVIADHMMALGGEPSTEPALGLVKAKMTPMVASENYDDSVKLLLKNCQELMAEVKETFELARDLKEDFTMAMMNQLAKQLGFTIGHFTLMRMAQMN